MWRYEVKYPPPPDVITISFQIIGIFSIMIHQKCGIYIIYRFCFAGQGDQETAHVMTGLLRLVPRG